MTALFHIGETVTCAGCGQNIPPGTPCVRIRNEYWHTTHTQEKNHER